MSVREEAFLFDCAGAELIGIIAAPEGKVPRVGVLVIVGGPQYRVGSHRQFVLLARDLAAHGVPCMRFDYRGMGDATGEQRNFEGVSSDISAAVDVFFDRQPGLQQVVLWGLCDGASAACLSVANDSRLAGLVLVNPWVRTVESEARTRLRHYYLKRIVDPAFWRKLLRGSVALGDSLGGLAGAAKAARSVDASAVGRLGDLPSRMARGLEGGNVPFALFLSSRDYVAKEFDDLAERSDQWRQIVQAAVEPGIRRFDADHTFSNVQARKEVADATLEAVMAFQHSDGVSR